MIKKIISADIADKGVDKTVIMYGLYNEDTEEYIVKEIYSEDKSDNMQIAGKIISWYREKGANIINIDTIGVGIGVVSRVKEVLGNEKVIINACHFGEGVGASGKESKPRRDETLADRKSMSVKKRFLNRKAEQYFRLKDLFDEGKISIPKDENLIKQLMDMRWELTSSGKIKIIDPESYSSDMSDVLVYFVWKVNNEVYFDFGGD